MQLPPSFCYSDFSTNKEESIGSWQFPGICIWINRCSHCIWDTVENILKPEYLRQSKQMLSSKGALRTKWITATVSQGRCWVFSQCDSHLLILYTHPFLTTLPRLFCMLCPWPHTDFRRFPETAWELKPITPSQHHKAMTKE